MHLSMLSRQGGGGWGEGGGWRRAGHRAGIWLFCIKCQQIFHPRVNNLCQIPTPGQHISTKSQQKKNQITLPRGQQNLSKALPTGQEWRLNPRPMPCSPPPPVHRLNIDWCIRTSAWEASRPRTRATNLQRNMWNTKYKYITTNLTKRNVTLVLQHKARGSVWQRFEFIET